MSFGLLTAINIEDVPKIMRRVSEEYRNTETRRFAHLWVYAADAMNETASIIEERIALAKATEPEFRIKRERL